MSGIAARVLQPEDLLAFKYVHDARLSADGRYVAYVASHTDGQRMRECFEIFIAETSAIASPHRKLAFADDARYPRWSPDGSRLAFVGTIDGRSRLYLAAPDCLEVKAITPEHCRVQGAPSWSPDGSTLVYTVVAQEAAPATARINKRIFRA